MLVPHPAAAQTGDFYGHWLVLWVEKVTDRPARVLAGCPRSFAERSDAFQHAVDQARVLNGDPRRTRKATRYVDLETCAEAYAMPRGEQWACGSGEQWKVTWRLEEAADRAGVRFAR